MQIYCTFSYLHIPDLFMHCGISQYRMHPEIRRFPSAHFYDNQLTDGLVEGSRKAPFHSEWCFAPYVFFDVVDGFSRTTNSNSLINDAEADAALNIYRFLLQR